MSAVLSPVHWPTKRAYPTPVLVFSLMQYASNMIHMYIPKHNNIIICYYIHCQIGILLIVKHKFSMPILPTDRGGNFNLMFILLSLCIHWSTHTSVQ